MALNYTSYNTALSLAEFFADIVAAGTFGTTSIWDSTTETTATVGDITLTKGTNSITISGGGFTSSNIGSTNSYFVKIAATENAIIFGWNVSQTGGTIANFAGIGKNSAGNWGAIFGNVSGSSITELIADGLSSKSFRPNTYFQSQVSTVNTQLIDISAAYGDFTFSDIYFVALSPSGTYDGKMTMNEEKYAQLHCLAMVYTD